MSSRSHARARSQSIGNVFPALFLGFILIAAIWAMRNGIARDPFVRAGGLDSFTHILKQTVIPEETVEVSPTVSDQEQAMGPAALMARWEPLIEQAAHRFHVPSTWIRAVMRMESGGRTVLPDGKPITSDAGAMGIMQVEPGTYEEMRAQYGLGADPYDPHDNVMAGAAYLRWLRGKYGYPAMFAAYNDGPGNLEDHLTKGRKLPAETRNYIAGIRRMLGLPKSGKAALVKFTRPDGTPIWVDSSKVSGLRAAVPGEYGRSVGAVVQIGGKQQAVRETVATASQLLRDHGGDG
ncbi:MAG TPA: lytic transglycosylase domain-containing protein [Rhizomicrobium sp.]|jgi:soluble lytic murein transglycosylase-like protein|nr:lytic transglycosylase domain-containing protein [Rhizomicrobium sp.]